MNAADRMPAPPMIPAVVTVNVEVESHDVLLAGGAGLFGRYSYGRYGAREGVWRLLDAFRDERVPATFFVDADDALRHPYLVEAILAAGHEVAQLGPRDIEEVSDPAVLRERLGSTRQTLASVMGVPPKGWRAAAGVMTAETLPLLAELGFAYDSSFQDDDHPYLFANPGGTRLAELPTFKYLTDTTFYSVRQPDATVRTAWFEELRAMYDERSYLALTVSSRGDIGSGRALRARIVRDWIHHAAAMPGVNFLSCRELVELKARDLTAEPFPFLEEFDGDLP
jgi:peptidoglycan/xylan/chitin deacetylase (PgdA/CDA1 family)